MQKRKHYAKLCENAGKVLSFKSFQRVLSQSLGVNQRLGWHYFPTFPPFCIKMMPKLAKIGKTTNKHIFTKQWAAQHQFTRQNIQQ